MKRISCLRRCAALALFAAAACDDGGTGPAAPASLVAMTATTQNATVASPAPVSPAVRVSDSRGNGLAGVRVAFAAAGGTVDPEALTDAGGVAVATNWMMGTVTQENTVTASVPGVAPVVFRATAGAGEAVVLEKAGGDGQAAAVATALPDSIAVRALDRFGNGVPGVVVNFAATGGHLSATRVSTGAAGHARVGLMLPTRPGSIQVFAGSGALEAHVFAVTVTAGPPAAMVRVAGDGQTARSAMAVAVAPAVRVTDSFGNPVPGRAVAFTPAPGSGVVTGGAAVTNADGRAQVGSWVLGEPGPNRLGAAVAGLDLVEFTATALEPCGNHTYTLFTAVTGLLDNGCGDANGHNAALYSFTVPSAQCVELRMSSSEFDTFLYLLDAEGQVLAWDDDGGDGLNSLIRWRLSAGSYFLGAAAYSGYATGTFQLSSSPVADGEWCGGAQQSQAVRRHKAPR